MGGRSRSPRNKALANGNGNGTPVSGRSRTPVKQQREEEENIFLFIPNLIGGFDFSVSSPGGENDGGGSPCLAKSTSMLSEDDG
jgi:hypothetical protein